MELNKAIELLKTVRENEYVATSDYENALNTVLTELNRLQKANETLNGFIEWGTNPFFEETKQEKQDKLKLIDVLNMIAKGELKAGTRVIYGKEEYIYDADEDDLLDKGGYSMCYWLHMKDLNGQVDLIEPESNKENHFPDFRKMEKIEELIADEINGKKLAEALSIVGAKLNEVIRAINKEQ